MSPETAQVAVVGGGAAGLMATIWAARSGADVVLMERTADGGRKILISGGGRCNVLPGAERPGDFVSDSSRHLVRRLLRAWPLPDQRAFFEDLLGATLRHEPETDKLFPASQKARDVRDGLVNAARAAGATLRFGTHVRDMAPIDSGWRIRLAADPPVDVAAVILATGGLSVPKTGSEGLGLQWCDRRGYVVHPTYPALTPLTADPHPHKHLAGVSLPVRIRGERKAAFDGRGGFLFTHRGWSGPAVLDASHLVTRTKAGIDPGPARLLVAWGAESDEEWAGTLRPGSGSVARALGRLPERLVAQLLAECRIPPDRQRSQLTRTERRSLIDALTAYPLPWTGDEGYKKAEVTGGGVALSEVDPRSLESRRHSGLFLCGELLDAFGPIGGHNFQWAWSTGRTAGLGAAAYLSEQTP
ncbi:MAG: aminoacetone oxidase family FAD-binding enzyme [Gemmatimonadetes bacterium]|nr:aminoacetone oxidase family FAD-binding enzyme [Gemmatimonadota bacterium]